MKLLFVIIATAAVLFGIYAVIVTPATSPVITEALKRTPVMKPCDPGVMEAQVTVFAVNPKTKEIKEFGTGCQVPIGWIPLTSGETQTLRETGVIK